MKASRVLQQQDGKWPTLTSFVGAEIIAAEIETGTGCLRLVFDSGALAADAESTLLIPEPWTFASCLLSASSTEFATGGGSEFGFHPAVDLIGLEGACLSGVEQDDRHLDLIFDSIRISVAGE